MSSTTAAPRIVLATGSLIRPRSKRTAAAIATLVAVSVAPTKIAIRNCDAFVPTSDVGTMKYAVRAPKTNGSTTPPAATIEFLFV